MKTTTARVSPGVWRATLLLAVLGASLPAQASNWGARREYREGLREISRERREMRRDILNSGSRAEASQAYREGMREISRERSEMRREVGRELRYGTWDRDRTRDVVAGVVLGAVISAAVRGAVPPTPAPGLCWYWYDSNKMQGFWDRCGQY
jgi:hypothetical protein